MCRFSLFEIDGIWKRLKCVMCYIKQTYLPRQTSCSRVNRPASVGSPELVGVNLGLRTHYEAESWTGPEFGHHPADLSIPLQRRLRVSEVYDNVKKRTRVNT